MRPKPNRYHLAFGGTEKTYRVARWTAYTDDMHYAGQVILYFPKGTTAEVVRQWAMAIKPLVPGYVTQWPCIHLAPLGTGPGFASVLDQAPHNPTITTP